MFSLGLFQKSNRNLLHGKGGRCLVGNFETFESSMVPIRSEISVYLTLLFSLDELIEYYIIYNKVYIAQ